MCNLNYTLHVTHDTFLKMTIDQIKNKKGKEKITMLTAYDYPTGVWLDKAGVDIVLVGDSVANVVLGLDSTTDMTMDQMIYHAQAVRRGVANALLIGDMPYESYQVDRNAAVDNAKRFIDEAGCDGVKLEWFDSPSLSQETSSGASEGLRDCVEVASAIVQAGIPVMGHVGLTPQTAEQLGGMKVQGKDADSAKAILKHAQALESTGCFSLVIECVPSQLAKLITDSVNIPTIGIGAGADCDGQVLVTHDMLGLFDRYRPKFVKNYVNLSEAIVDGVKQYCNEVKGGKFPAGEHEFNMNEEDLKKLKE